MINSIIEEVKKRLNISEDFVKAEKGTRSQVFLSDNFVIKINSNFAMLKNEREVLGLIDLKIVPRYIDFFIIKDRGVLVEQRIKGLAIDDVWKSTDIINRERIVADIAGMVYKVNELKRNYFWSAQFNEKFKNYKDLLFYKFYYF